MDMTPEGDKWNFIKLREPMNKYAHDEQAKGVRIRLYYNRKFDITLSPVHSPPSMSTPTLSGRNTMGQVSHQVEKQKT